MTQNTATLNHLPKNIEEWLKSQRKVSGYAYSSQAQWPQECGMEYSKADRKNIMGSLQDIMLDLKQSSPWEPALLDNIDDRLQKVEETLKLFGDKFICEGHPASSGQRLEESVTGGLESTANKAFLTDLCDVDFPPSRNLGALTPDKNKRQVSQLSLNSQDNETRTTVDSLRFPRCGTDMTTSLPPKLEPLPILDLVSRLQKHVTVNSIWKKLFFSDASSSLLTNVFWWVWLDYFKPNAALQSALFDMISENFVSLIHNMDDKYKDVIFMHYPDCLSQAVYSAFCQACPDSNKVLNSEPFLNYLSNTISEWIIGVKPVTGEWKKWPVHLLNPYYNISSAKSASDRPPSSTKGSMSALTDKDVMALSMSQFPGQNLRRQTNPPGYRVQSSKVHFENANRPELKKSVSTSQQLMISASQSEHGQNTYDADEVSHTSDSILECVRFSVSGLSPLLQHFLIRHHLVEKISAPPGSVISRRQVKEVPRTPVEFVKLLKESRENSDKHYKEYESEMAEISTSSMIAYKNHLSELRKMNRQNKRILEHRYEVAILAEKLVTQKKDKQNPIPGAHRMSPAPDDGQEQP